MTPTPVPILLYHSISSRIADQRHAYSVSSAVFAEHVLAFQGRPDASPLTVATFAAVLRGDRPLPSGRCS